MTVLSIGAACVLIRRHGFVLGVCRPGTTDQWGIPGGKIEPNETAVEAAARELAEETGFQVNTEDLVEVFRRPAVSGAMITVTFAPRGERYLDGNFRGDAGPVGFVTWEELFAGPFGVYNRALYEAVR